MSPFVVRFRDGARAVVFVLARDAEDAVSRARAHLDKFFPGVSGGAAGGHATALEEGRPLLVPGESRGW